MFEAPTLVAAGPDVSPSLLEQVQVATAALDASGADPGSVRLLGTPQVAQVLAGLDALRARAEALTARVVADAMARGLPEQQRLSARDWTTRACPHLPGKLVGDVVGLAHAMNEPVHGPVVEQVERGRLGVARAAAVLRTLRRVSPALDPYGYEQAMGTLLEVAGGARFTETDLKRVSDHLISVVMPDHDHDKRDQVAHEMRGVHESSLADGSLVRFIITCDPEGAATLRAVMASPLAAPASGSASDSGPATPSADSAVDPRSGTQRRYDALLAVLRRGLAAGDTIPTTAAATVMVTIAYDTLANQLTGTGTTGTGEVLAPATVRRLACDADLVPAVLGTHREILDLGRARRLVTPGQRRALHHRDQRCTYPGCTTPAGWCDAHHVKHWSRGGRSDVSNYALLCRRHHTHVHAHDMTATVTSSGVTWHE